jgi:hypothetical protein
MGAVRRGGYRVELRAGGRAEELGVLGPATFAHHASLTPFVSRLRLDGRADGEVVLVERATGRVVARQRLDRPRRRPPARRAGARTEDATGAGRPHP